MTSRLSDAPGAVLADTLRGPSIWISHSRPAVGEAERDRLCAVLDSRYLANGPKSRDFEAALGRFLGYGHARAVASGTCALQLALLSLAPDDCVRSLEGLARFFRGRTVLVPAYVCSAVLYAVEWVGATPVFVDVEEDTGCADPERMAEQAGPETIAAVVAYLFGHPGQKDLPQHSNLVWIEDIAQAIGALRAGQPVGSQGHSAVCSFYATKVITTGSGGMVLTREPEAGQRVERLLQYDHQSDGLLHLSWAMSDVQAALGLAQWQQLGQRIQRRRRIAQLYTEVLADESLIEALPATGSDRRRLIEGHIYYRYPIRLRRGLERFIEGMKREGVEVKRPVFSPLYRLRGGNPEAFPVTEKLFATTASLPIYPELSEAEAEHVAGAAKRVLAVL